MINFEITLGGHYKAWKVGKLAFYDEEEGRNVKGFYLYSWPFMLRVTCKVGGG